MAFQFSTTARNNAIGTVETTVGTAPTLKIYSGSVPASCAAAATGVELASGTLPTDWLNAASGGSVTIAGSPWAITGVAAGTGGYFRILAGATCHIQGTITATGGGGDMTLDNTSIAVSQSVNINSFTMTAGGA